MPINSHKFSADMVCKILSGYGLISEGQKKEILLKKEPLKRKMEKVKKFRTWYEYVQDIAGAWYLEAVEHLFLKNELIKG